MALFVLSHVVTNRQDWHQDFNLVVDLEDYQMEVGPVKDQPCFARLLPQRRHQDLSIGPHLNFLVFTSSKSNVINIRNSARL